MNGENGYPYGLQKLTPIRGRKQALLWKKVKRRSYSLQKLTPIRGRKLVSVVLTKYQEEGLQKLTPIRGRKPSQNLVTDRKLFVYRS